MPEPAPEVNPIEVDTDLITALSEGIGPRPPGSNREHVAADVIAGELAALGLSPRIERFDSQRSFGSTYLVIFGLAMLSWLLSRSTWSSSPRSGTDKRRLDKVRPIAGAMTGLLAAALGGSESNFALRSPLNPLRSVSSQNVWAAVEPERDPTGDQYPATQTICLVSHMDSSRSGLMFHPSVTPHLGKLVGTSGVAVLVNSLAPLLSRSKPGRVLVGLARFLIACSAAMIVEREVRGVDVPGANDNASGVAACLHLAAHFSEQPLKNSRLVVLVTGSEESGVIGMRNFLASHDTSDWLFVNFDGVSADAPLRVLSRENGPLGKKADRELLGAAAEVGRAAPELKAEPLTDGSGLPYDATAVMTRGGRAITVVNQEGAIPDYHWPTDTADRVSEEAFSRAVRFGAALVLNLDEKA